MESSINTMFDQAYEQDFVKTFISECKAGLRTGVLPATIRRNRISASDCEVRDNKLLLNGRLYVPPYKNLRMRIIQRFHDDPLSGPQGIARTVELIQRHQLWWPKLSSEVAIYTRNCWPCRQSNPSNLKRQGSLAPLFTYKPGDRV